MLTEVMVLNTINVFLRGSVLPYCIIGLSAFVGGPISIFAGGAAVFSGPLQPLPVYLAVVSGNLVADLGWYSLGRFSRPEWLEKIAPKLGVDTARVKQLEQLVRVHVARLIFFAKFTIGFPIPTLISIGLTRAPVLHWSASWLLGELLKSGVLMIAGYYFASAFQHYSNGAQMLLWGLTGTLVFAGLLWYKRLRKKPV